MKIKIAAIGLILFSVIFLNGCHTTKNFEEDMEYGGQPVKNFSADDIDT
jgi:hypothetical protein